MGNYSQLIIYGFCILLVNNIANSDATFFGFLHQASSGPAHGIAAAPRTSAPAPAAVGGANNELLLTKLTQISSKLSMLLGGIGGLGGGGGAAAAAGPVAAPAEAAEEIESTDEEISPKIGGDDDDDVMKKDEDSEPDYVVEDHKENESDSSENEIKAVRKQSNIVRTRTSNGRIATNNGNGYQLRKSITTSNSGRAASIRPQGVRVNSQQSSGFVTQTRNNISPGVLAAISTSDGGYQNSVQTVQRSGGSVYNNYQTQPVVQRAGGYNYQNPGYRYRTVRYY